MTKTRLRPESGPEDHDLKTPPPLCCSLAECRLTGKSCEILASAMASSNITELHLHGNNLTDEGVPQLCGGLEKSKIHTLRLEVNCRNPRSTSHCW